MSAGLREVHFPECKFERSIDVFLRAPLEDQIAGPRLAPGEGGEIRRGAQNALGEDRS